MQATLILILFAIPAFIFFQILFKYIRFFVKRIKIGDLPKPSYRFPLLSHTLGRSRAIFQINEEMLTKYPDADFYDFGPDLFGYPVVAVNNLDAAKEIFNDEKFPKAFDKSSLAASKMIGRGLVTSSGQLWKKERRVLTPGFHFATLKEQIPTVVDEARRFVDKLKELSGAPVQAKQIFVSVTLRVIIATAFGGQFDADWMEKKWLTIFNHIIPYALASSIFGSLADYLPFSSPFASAVDEISKKSKEFIALRRQTPAENQTKADVVGLLLHSGETDDDLIIDEAKTFLVAGHETTSNLLAWSSCFLSRHPDVQEKAYQEVMEVLGDREPTADDIPKLRYIKAIMEETLRMRPVVAILPVRTTLNEVTLMGRTFPAETRFTVNILGVHMNEKYWTNAEEFIPERFLESGKEMKKHPFAFIPFSAGPRNCLGQKFSLQEGAIILSMILKEFSITMSENSFVQPVIKPTLSPDGARLKFIPRRK